VSEIRFKPSIKPILALLSSVLSNLIGFWWQCRKTLEVTFSHCHPSFEGLFNNSFEDNVTISFKPLPEGALWS